MKKIRKQEEQVSLLKELCGDDEELYDCLANHLFENPLTALPDEDLDTLAAEADTSGKYGFAVDKAIFEAAQNPGDRERYEGVVLDLASNCIRAMEKENAEADKHESVDMSTSFERRLAHQKLLSERTKEVVNIATRFYEEKLADLGANIRRDERETERKSAEREGRKIDEEDRAEREDRKGKRKGLGRRERKEAKKRDRTEKEAAEERKGTRENTRLATEREEMEINEQEKAARQARKEDSKR